MRSCGGLLLMALPTILLNPVAAAAGHGSLRLAYIRRMPVRALASTDWKETDAA